MHFEAEHAVIDVIRNNYLKHNDTVLRHWIAKVENSVSVRSPLYVEGEDAPERKYQWITQKELTGKM